MSIRTKLLLPLIGFLVAAGLGTVLAGFWVNQHVRNLEYDTFTPQPLYG